MGNCRTSPRCPARGGLRRTRPFGEPRAARDPAASLAGSVLGCLGWKVWLIWLGLFALGLFAAFAPREALCLKILLLRRRRGRRLPERTLFRRGS